MINFSNFPLSNTQYDYNPLLLSENYIAIYQHIIQQCSKEIIKLLFDFLLNICVDDHKSCDIIQSHPQFILQMINCLIEKDLFFGGIKSILTLILQLSKEPSFASLHENIIKQIMFVIQKTIELVNDEEIIFVCVRILVNLSDSTVNYLFQSIGLFKTLLFVPMANEDVNKKIISIVNNVIMSISDPNYIIASLLEINILDYYYNILTKTNSNILIQREILLSLANIAYNGEIYAIKIVTHTIFSFIIDSLFNNDRFIKSNAIATLFNSLDYETLSLEPLFSNSNIIRGLLYNLSNETNQRILNNIIISIIRLGNIELSISKNKEDFFRQTLLTNGIEDYLARNEVRTHSIEFADKLKEFLYNDYKIL